MVAIDSNKKIYLIREYCYAIEKYDLKIPSGGVDKGETPLKAAKRELKEETGMIAKNWIELGFINPLNMILNNSAYLFLALNLIRQDKTEKEIEVVPMPFEKAHQMVIDSKITHSPSCVAILKAKIYLDSVNNV